MKLKELFKLYYKVPSEVTMSTPGVIPNAYKELTLPGSYQNLKEFRKTLSWNLDRDIYYREATKDTSDKDQNLYVTMTTGRMDFYFIFQDDSEFTNLLEAGLKKHKSYRKEYLPWSDDRKYLFYSKRYER